MSVVSSKIKAPVVLCVGSIQLLGDVMMLTETSCCSMKTKAILYSLFFI